MFRAYLVDGMFMAPRGEFPSIEAARQHLEQENAKHGYTVLAFDLDGEDAADMMTGDGHFRMNQYAIERIRK